MRVMEIETGRRVDLEVTDGRFSAVVEAGPAGAAGDAGGWVLPGLVDVHNHLSLASPAGDRAEPGERVRASASLELALGVLALREPGSPDDASAALAGEPGWPRVITAGRFLAPPGGYYPGLAREVDEAGLATAAEQEAARSGGWAKIIGDFLNEQRQFTPNWSAAGLTQAIARVHERGGRVAVHALCPAAVEDAIAAGADSIEHGWAITDDHFAAMRAAGTAWVPTLPEGGSNPVCAFGASMGIPADTLEWMRYAVDAQPATAARAHAAGVVVLAGTDAGQGPHGRIIEQVELLAAGGIPPRDAIGAASWTARRYLGLPGIQTGAPADFIRYDHDPTGDLDVLRHPAEIVLGGQVRQQSANPVPLGVRH